MQIDLNGKILRLMQDDITRLAVDAICNAANAMLAGGGGVDGAIHNAGGPAIMAELNAIRTRDGGCSTGSAVATTAGLLPARFVFHAVGPVYNDGQHGEPRLLASCYRTCLQLAEERMVKRISFPSISTGVYGYPLADAAPIALQAVRDHLTQERCVVEEVTFVLFDERTRLAYERALRGEVAGGWK
ncbi:MAG: O-acetyl-ADP-ribose deacetylase [Acidobacteria bacterium]|nr:O-acetyl-ADP-ribose deacetylase [Acidobacteriota bacterium]